MFFFARTTIRRMAAGRLETIAQHVSPHSSMIRQVPYRRQHSTMPSLALLDDYPGIAPKHFHHIDGLKIDSFPDTLDPKTSPGLEALVQRLEPYEIISTMRERTPFPADLLERLPKLKLLLTTSVRNAAIDLPTATSRGVTVTGTKGTPPANPGDWHDLPPEGQWTSVNQHAWALLLSLCSRIPRDDAALKGVAGAWQSGLMVPLGGKVLGCVGLGKLGALMARTGALGFGMRVVAWSESLTQERCDGVVEGYGYVALKWTVRVSPC